VCTAESSRLVESAGWDVDVEDGDVDVVDHDERMRSCSTEARVDYDY
jgi:hypothetical protein